jgi:hypothetical protein
MPHTSPHHLTELHSPLPPPTAVKQQPPNLRVRLARHSLPATRSLLLHRHGHCNRANWSSSISRQQTGGNLLHPRTERGIDRTNLEERQTEPFQTGENKGQARVVMNYSCFLSLPLFPAKSVVSKQRARMSMTASRPPIFFASPPSTRSLGLSWPWRRCTTLQYIPSCILPVLVCILPVLSEKKSFYERRDLLHPSIHRRRELLH